VRVAEGLYQYETSGHYYARFRHKGERIMQRLGDDRSPCTALPEARRLLRALKNDLEQTDVVSTRKTLAQVIAEYRETLTGAKSTLDYKKLHLTRLEEQFPLPATTKLRDIKRSDIIQFMAQFDTEGSTDRWNAILTVVRDLFRYAIADKVIAVSPVEGIKYKRRKDTIRRLIPSFKEFEAIVASVRSQKLSDTAKESADLIEFMGLCGLGQAECAEMTWGHINFQTNRISIIRKKTSTEFSIPIYPQVRPLLERMNSERLDPSPDDFVFSVKNPKKALDNACSRLNFPNYSARSFRRLFITRCLELGIDPQTIAEWQGHRDGGQLILKVYGRVTQRHQRSMASRLAHPSRPKKAPSHARRKSP